MVQTSCVTFLHFLQLLLHNHNLFCAMCGRTRCAFKKSTVYRKARVPAERWIDEDKCENFAPWIFRCDPAFRSHCIRCMYILLTPISADKPQYNCIPGMVTPVVYYEKPSFLPSAVLESAGASSATASKSPSSGSGASSGEYIRVVRSMHWGLIPFFTKPGQKPDFFRCMNARSETCH